MRVKTNEKIFLKKKIKLLNLLIKNITTKLNNLLNEIKLLNPYEKNYEKILDKMERYEFLLRKYENIKAEAILDKYSFSYSKKK